MLNVWMLLLLLFQVRPQCIAGMHCLLGMVQGYVSTPAAGHHSTSSRSSSGAGQAASASAGGEAGAVQQPAATKPSAGVVLLRQMDQYQLFPSAEQLHLVDKKFGGEPTPCAGMCIQGRDCAMSSQHQATGIRPCTIDCLHIKILLHCCLCHRVGELVKADVLGVEAEEVSSDEEEEEAAQQATSSSSSGSKAQQRKVQPELTGSHAAAAAAKAASAKLQQLLADSTEMGSAPTGTAGAAAAKSLRSRRSVCWHCVCSP